MPEPFFSQNQPGQYWLEDLNAWNQDRSRQLHRPEAYGLLGDDRDKLRDQEIMDMILRALLSDKGLGAYRSALPPRPQGAPNDLQRGVQELKKQAKRDPLGDADRIAYGP